jgi:hypothetical protein
MHVACHICFPQFFDDYEVCVLTFESVMEACSLYDSSNHGGKYIFWMETFQEAEYNFLLYISYLNVLTIMSLYTSLYKVLECSVYFYDIVF